MNANCTPAEDRRVSFFSPLVDKMQILRLDSRNDRIEESVTLPWIEKFTTGRFYLSEYSIAFENPDDMFMFKLAFRK